MRAISSRAEHADVLEHPALAGDRHTGVDALVEVEHARTERADADAGAGRLHHHLDHGTSSGSAQSKLKPAQPV